MRSGFEAFQRPPARRSALSVRHENEARQTPHQVGLQIMQAAVHVNHFPQHLHELDALLVRKFILHHPREPEGLNRVLHPGFGELQQGLPFLGAQSETIGHQLNDLSAFRRIEIVIHARRLDQQGRRGHLAFLEFGLGLTGSGAAGLEKRFDPVNHGLAYHDAEGRFNPCSSGGLGACGGRPKPVACRSLEPDFSREESPRVSQSDPRRYAPAAARNRQPILEVLMRLLPAEGLVLEIASGSGEHAVWFAERLPALRWQPSDPDPDCRRSIAAHAAAGGVGLGPPLNIDVMRPDWPIERADAVICINMIHVAPWEATKGLMVGAGRILPAGGILYLYGPFRREGRHTAASNAAFDDSLRRQDPQWGVRDLEAVTALAEDHGLALIDVIEMPANNLSVCYQKL